jgi:hypothetical protein
LVQPGEGWKWNEFAFQLCLLKTCIDELRSSDHFANHVFQIQTEFDSEMERKMESLAKCDAWEQTLSLLARVSSKSPNSADCTKATLLGKSRIGADGRRGSANRCGLPPSAFVSVLERCSPTSVAICWCDATSGRYGDQLWKLRVARGRAVCALSGKTIRRGDLIYRPCVRGRSPANADQAIAADALEEWERESIRQNMSSAPEVSRVRPRDEQVYATYEPALNRI